MPRYETHGLSNSPEYHAWEHAKARCVNPNEQSYHNYGGRGISMCERWLNSFENFYADMGPKPSQNLTIDRIDNDGNYNPDNCRWTTRTKQQRNQRMNARNTSGVTGVYLNNLTNRWCAQIKVAGKQIYLGSFVTKSEAATARSAGEIKYWGVSA